MADDSDSKKMGVTDAVTGAVIGGAGAYAGAVGSTYWNTADAKDKDGNKLEGQKHGVLAAETKATELAGKHTEAWQTLEKGLVDKESVLLAEAKEAAKDAAGHNGKFVDEVIKHLQTDGKAKEGAEELIKKLNPVAKAGHAAENAAVAAKSMKSYVAAVGESRYGLNAVRQTIAHKPIAFAAGTAIVALLGAMAMNRWRSSGQPELDSAGARSR